jgi:hypothetical protein
MEHTVCLDKKMFTKKKRREKRSREVAGERCNGWWNGKGLAETQLGSVLAL